MSLLLRKFPGGDLKVGEFAAAVAAVDERGVLGDPTEAQETKSHNEDCLFVIVERGGATFDDNRFPRRNEGVEGLGTLVPIENRSRWSMDEGTLFEDWHGSVYTCQGRKMG